MEEVNSAEEAATKIVDRWTSSAPPPFLDLAIPLVSGSGGPSSERLESLVHSVAAKRQPAVRFQILSVQLKGYRPDRVCYTVYASRQV